MPKHHHRQGAFFKRGGLLKREDLRTPSPKVSLTEPPPPRGGGGHTKEERFSIINNTQPVHRCNLYEEIFRAMSPAVTESKQHVDTNENININSPFDFSDTESLLDDFPPLKF